MQQVGFRRHAHRASRLLGAILVAALAVTGLTFALTPQESAEAYTGADFDAGLIISDSNFFNGDAMTAAEVQAFINGKISSCAAGSTCLRDLRIDTWTIPATPMCATYEGAAGETAATIIAKVGKACGVSQAVLLVMLQKEQSLVTARAPSDGAIAAAMGVGCYDDGQPCVGTYAGFFNQLFNGAYLLKRYTQPAGTGPGTPYTSRFDLRFPVGQISQIQYHPNTGCGTKDVYVANQATHALYIYTPYTPNAAALANLGTVGDSCSSYGNRNFWALYRDWFGDPVAGNAPIGWLDSMTVSGSQVTAKGWAIDTDTTAAIPVRLTVDGTVVSTTTADTPYPGLGGVHVGFGDNHGFSATATLTAGNHTVCIIAVNDTDGSNRQLGCRDFALTTVETGQVPIGWLDAVTVSGAQITAAGWAIDTDTILPISVTMTVDDVIVATVAADRRYTGLGGSFPGFGDNHGFTATTAAAAGSHTVCITAVNNGAGGDRSLGCRTVTIAPTPTGTEAPIGWLDVVTVSGAQITASGWAIDKDTTSAITVQMTVDGTLATSVTADRAYPGLGGVHVGFGDNHGYTASASSTAGTHTVCITAVNNGAGGDRSLGCRTVSVGG